MRIKFFWFLLYFISTEGFALRGDSWGGFGTPSIGLFGISQLLLWLVSLIAVLPGLGVLVHHSKSNGGKLALAFGLIPLYMYIVSVLGLIWGSEISLAGLFSTFVELKFFLMFYLFVYLCSKPNGIEKALDGLAFSSVVLSLSFLVIVIFDVETAVTAVKESSDITRLFRVIVPGSLLMAIGGYLFFSRFIVSGGVYNILFSFICMMANVAQMHRGVLIATFVSTLVLIKWSVFESNLMPLKRKIFVVCFWGVIIFSGSILSFSSGGLVSEYLSANTTEILEFSSNFGHRIFLVVNSWNYVISDTFGFGVGFVWEHVDDLEVYLFNSFNAGPTNDSSYANIIIILGVPGIFLFAGIFYTLSVFFKSIRANSRDPFLRGMGVFFGVVLIYILLVSTSSDIIFISNSTVIFSIFIALSFSLRHRVGRGPYL